MKKKQHHNNELPTSPDMGSRNKVSLVCQNAKQNELRASFSTAHAEMLKEQIVVELNTSNGFNKSDPKLRVEIRH